MIEDSPPIVNDNQQMMEEIIDQNQVRNEKTLTSMEGFTSVMYDEGDDGSVLFDDSGCSEDFPMSNQSMEHVSNSPLNSNDKPMDDQRYSITTHNNIFSGIGDGSVIDPSGNSSVIFNRDDDDSFFEAGDD